MFYTIEDLHNLPSPKWLIEGLFERECLAMLVGPPGAFKSFLALDWALCLAAGRPWNGRSTEPSTVLYMLGEGKANLVKRINAWIWHNKLDKLERARLNANFRITFNVPQLASRREVNEFINSLDEEGFSPTVIFVDTLARSFVGKDENSQTDAGLWVDGADSLRQRGAAVIALHHTKKNTEFGLQYRGSTALQGAMDTAATLHRDPDGMKGYAKLTCSKQKDHDEFKDIWMKRERVVPPDNEQGSIVMTLVERPGQDEIDERNEREDQIDSLIASLIQDSSFDADKDRAKVLMDKFNLAEGTAKTRISRARKKVT